MAAQSRHRPTIVLLAAFVGLVLVTMAIVGYRLAFTQARFVDSAGPEPSPSIASPSPSEPTVTITGVGDIIMGSTSLGLPPNDAAGFFDAVAPALNGDIVTGNFEGALTEDTGYDKCRPPQPDSSSTTNPASPSPSPTSTTEPRVTCYAFRMPPSYAARLAEAKFNVINLANNHTNDYGGIGLRNTQQALSQHDVDYTGMPGQFAIRQVGSTRVAVLGFAPYGWSARLTDIPRAAALVREAAAQADLVIVHMQAGGEGADKQHVKAGTETYLGENRGDPIAFAHAVIDAGADLVIGHGPHVMRGMEWYQGRLIAYSLGNFAGYKVLARSGPGGVGGLLKVTLRPDGSFVRGELIATKLVAPGLPALDSDRASVAQVSELSTQDFGPHAVNFSAVGTIRLN